MSKNNLNSFQPVKTDYEGPTLQELELLLNRIEELDAKREEEPTGSSSRLASNSSIRFSKSSSS